MATVEVEVRVLVDGQPMTGFPVVRRVTVADFQRFDFAKADDAGVFSSLPGLDVIESLNVLLVRPAAAMTVRLDGQTDAGILLNADGLLLILDGTLDAGPTDNATLSNASGDTAQVRGFGAGD